MRRLVIVLAVAAVAVSIYALRTGPRATPPAPPTFTFNNGTEPKTLDPARMTGVPAHTLALALFEGLVTVHPKTLAPVPGVAERWTVSDDGRVYTFRLRRSRWSNGDPVTAHDFLYSWRRVLDPKTAARYAYQLWYIRNARAYTKGTLADFAQVGVRAPDPYTLEVTLEHPVPYFLELLAFATYAPVHKGCVERFGRQWTRPGKLVCNGPFLLREWRPRDRIVLEKNPRYWDAANVRLERIVALPIENESTALRRYLAGELDWLNPLPPLRVPELKKRPDYHKAPYLATYFFRFNCTRKPFHDRRVRQAFALALDRDDICRTVWHGEYRPARSFVPPMIPGYTPPAGLKHDPRRAAELLAAAGYPGGKGFPRVTLLYNTSEQNRRVAVIAQDMWRKTLGVEVDLLSQEFGVYLNTMSRLDYDIARSGWIGDYLDPNTFLDMFVTDGGNNRTGWSHRRYDAWIAEAARTADRARRLDLLRDAEDLLVNRETPITPVFFYANLSLRRPRVRGFYSNPRDLHPFKHIFLAESVRRHGFFPAGRKIRVECAAVPPYHGAAVFCLPVDRLRHVRRVP